MELMEIIINYEYYFFKFIIYVNIKPKINNNKIY